MRILQASGQIPEPQLESALATAGNVTGALARLLESGLDEQLVLTILSRTYDLPIHQLIADTVMCEAVQLLPPNFLLEEQILPFAINGRSLQIAIIDPSRAALGNQVKALSSYNAVFFLVAPQAYQEAIEHPSIRGLLDDTPPPAPSTAPQPRMPRALSRRRAQYDVSDARQVIQFVDDVLYLAAESNCSDIHIEPYRERARVRMRIDGVLHVMEPFADYLGQNYLAIITRFKLLAGCDISEKRMPQDGAMSFQDRHGTLIDARFSIVPTKHGERCVIRLLRNETALHLNDIGFSSDDLRKLTEAISAPQGMVLVTGPTGSGKTTTLYSALQWLNEPHKNIMTAEDPIEYYLEGLGQIQANERLGLGFGEIMRAFLRQDPEIILLGEIRDQETVEMAVKTALTGHLLLSTLHTNDAISTINRLTNMGVEAFMIAAALSLVVAQRLARRNCPNCLGVDTQVDAQMLRRIGFPDEESVALRVKKGCGCEVCHGSGYQGRQGVYEVLRVTSDIEAAILAGAREAEILEVARTDGFITLSERGRDFMRAGVLSFTEFSRVLRTN